MPTKTNRELRHEGIRELRHEGIREAIKKRNLKTKKTTIKT